MNHQTKLLQTWHSEETTPFTGWDFSHLKNRMIGSNLPWSYVDRARALLAKRTQLLDMGTGGGERLLDLKDDWPQTVVVTEEYQPNFELAKRRLGPLGVRVENVALARKGQMPFADCSFDVVLNRHSGFNPGEVARILLPGGVFFTQQVHGLSLEDLMAEFGTKPNWPEAKPESYVPELESAGFSIITCEEYQGRLVFSDVGAIIYLLKAIPWLVNDFSVDRYAENLYRLQSRIEHKGELLFTERHYLIEAVKTRELGA